MSFNHYFYLVLLSIDLISIIQYIYAIIPGDYNVEATPGYIPNPEVKLNRAYDTALVTKWESG